MEIAQFNPDDFDKLIEIAVEYGGLLIVLVSFLVAFLRRGRRKEKKQREAALGSSGSKTDPIEPGDDTGKRSEWMQNTP